MGIAPSLPRGPGAPSPRRASSEALAAAYLEGARAPLPGGSAWGSLAVVSLGAVLGSALLSALALRSGPASHGGVVIALGGLWLDPPAAMPSRGALRGFACASAARMFFGFFA